MIKVLKKSLKKHLKLIMFFPILRESIITITLVMQLSRIEEVEKEDLEILIFQIIFLIFLRTFLAKDLVVVEDQGDQITEAQI